MRNEIITSFIGLCLFISGYSQRTGMTMSGNPPVLNDSVIQSLIIEKPITAHNNKSIYFINRPVDIPIVIAGSAFSIFGLSKIYNKDPSTPEQVNSLKISDINSFDRMAVYSFSNTPYQISNAEFYASIPLPFIVFLFNQDTRQEYGKLSFLYWEILSVTGIFGVGGPYFIDRYRPYVYKQETAMDIRLDGVAKNSAFSGHTEIVAASVFFIAKVYSDYYPERKFIMFSLASVATGAMGYMRIVAGGHFISDVFIGAAIGTLSGILVPHFHKNKSRDSSLGFVPYSNSNSRGFILTYQIK